MRIIFFLVALVSAPLALAGVDVVKVINFSCQHCRNSESIDAPIRAAVAQTGGKFVYATMPASENVARELFYYTVRDAYPAKEPAFRQAMFAGAQDAQQPFASSVELSVWLSSRLNDPEINWDWLSTNGDREASRQALGRALRLILEAGSSSLPSYVLLKDGHLVGAIDFNAQTSYADLRERVLAQVRALHSKGIE